MTEVTADDIQQLLDMGMSKKEAGEQLGLSAQKVGMILKKADGDITDLNSPSVEGKTEIAPHKFAKEYADVARTEEGGSAKVVIMTSDEYRRYSEANGRFEGREPGRKIMPKPEELRALINAGAKPSYIMNKFGINRGEFKQQIWKLSKLELRDKPIAFDFDSDYIQV